MTTSDFYPHLPAKWVNQATLGLRSRGASGVTIGDALAVAEAHCAESGESVEEAFGAPLAFAQSVTVPKAEGDDSSWADQALSAWPALLGLSGMFLAFACFNDWSNAAGIGIRAGVAAAVLIIVAASILLVRYPAVIAARPWLGGLLFTATFVALVVIQNLISAPLFRVPQVLAVIASVGLLIASVTEGYRVNAVEDHVVDPLRGDPSPKSSRLVALVTPWLSPVLTVVGLLILNLIAHAA